MDEAGDIMKAVARDWRELLAGSEGFLTGRGRAGCERREAVWGEMVSGPFSSSGIWGLCEREGRDGHGWGDG